MQKLRCASFFAGVGGIDLGFESVGGFHTIYATEFNKYAAKTYESNFNSKVDLRDINTVSAEEIPDFDVMHAGFPCQAFSIMGKKEGFNDKKGRGKLFFQLVRIFRHKKPSILFFENVKNLVHHDNGNTFKVILDSIKQEGYSVKFKVLNATEYGNIPQNRERVYIVAFKDKDACDKFDFPKPINLTTSLNSLINFDEKLDEKYYYTSKCSFYDKIQEGVINSNSIYQWHYSRGVQEKKNNVSPTLKASMGSGGYNVPFIKTFYGIRRLTPRECFNLQGFPKTFILPPISDYRLYEQAGNSVAVPVIERIAYQIKKVLC